MDRLIFQHFRIKVTVAFFRKIFVITLAPLLMNRFCYTFAQMFTYGLHREGQSQDQNNRKLDRRTQGTDINITLPTKCQKAFQTKQCLKIAVDKVMSDLLAYLRSDEIKHARVCQYLRPGIYAHAYLYLALPRKLWVASIVPTGTVTTRLICANA